MYSFLILFLLLNIFFLSSKVVILILLLATNIYVVRILRKRYRISSIVAVVLLVNFSFILISFNIPSVQKRFADVIESDFNVIPQERYNYDTPFTGLTLRIVFWKAVTSVLNEENAWFVGFIISKE